MFDVWQRAIFILAAFDGGKDLQNLWRKLVADTALMCANNVKIRQGLICCLRGTKETGRILIPN
ncbi:MAG: hypothetical protein IKP64_02955, partial [Selenomonadaceae bacterium]|nr:hypothetical protein [Selenomonadaceae bacterium]